MLAAFLFGELRTRILSVLLLRPERSWHVRELARQIGALPGSTNRELHKLSDAGILSHQSIGNQVHYSANPDCPVLAELTGLLRKTSGFADVIADALRPLSATIQSAFIFGSVARGQETAYSDIDVLALGEVGFGDLLEVLYPLQETLRREIDVVVYRVADFRRKLASGNTWARGVVSSPKLFLIGAEDSFGKLIESAVYP